MAALTVVRVRVLAALDQILGPGNRHRGDRHALRLEPLAPRAAIHPEFLKIAHEGHRLLRRHHEHERGGGGCTRGREPGPARARTPQVEHRRAVQREAVVGRRAHEGEAGVVREEKDRAVRGEREVAPELRRRHEPRRSSLDAERDRQTIEEPGEPGHDRFRQRQARIPEVRVVPVVAVLSADAREVGTDAAGPEEMREVVGILARLRDRPPAKVLAGDGSHVLAVAVPAAFADVDGPAAPLRRGVVARVVPDPLQVAEVGADGTRHLPRARFGDD